jgi:uncharacterized protein (DUF4415 family)
VSIARQIVRAETLPKPEKPTALGPIVEKPQAQVADVYTASKAGKSAISIRLDTDLIEALRATGSGWQTRVNDILRQHLKL